ncbi:hypothetical protein [Catellatospora sp. NPDC049609]|uniref:hypothetical protein n=1 Tax=Catellatospora sp. NPDC049609 TaxID=3155505 RepID=UPI003415A05E
MPEPMDQIFADFASDTAGTFRAAPVEALTSAVRRRRRIRHAGLAALALVVVATPVVVLGLAGRGQTPPVLTPSTPAAARPSAGPSASPPPPVAPAPQVETRPVRVPGVAPGYVPRTVIFTDAAHGWALLEKCDGGCDSVPASTADGGRTWRKVGADLDLRGKTINLYPLDDQTAVLHLVRERFLLTRDGGATFSAHPLSAPPTEALLAGARAQGREGYVLLCPGALGFEDGASGIECEQEQLIKIGSGPVSPQPKLGGAPNRPSTVYRGADGRLWLVTSLNDEGQIRLQISTDDARTWRELPAPLTGRLPGLLLPARGPDAWLVGQEGALWRRTGAAWNPQHGLPAETLPHQVVVLRDGSLLLSDPRGVWHLRYPTLTLVSGLPPMEQLSRLPDGTLLGSGGGARWLSPDEPADPVTARPWIKIPLT